MQRKNNEWNLFNITKGPPNVMTSSIMSVYDVAGETKNVNAIRATLYDIIYRDSRNKRKTDNRNKLVELLSHIQTNLDEKPDNQAKRELQAWVDAVRKSLDTTELRYVSKKEFEENAALTRTPFTPRQPLLERINLVLHWGNETRTSLLYAQSILMRKDIQDFLKNPPGKGQPINRQQRALKSTVNDANHYIQKNLNYAKRAEKKLARLVPGSPSHTKFANKINATNDLLKEIIKSFPAGYQHGFKVSDKINVAPAVSNTNSQPSVPATSTIQAQQTKPGPITTTRTESQLNKPILKSILEDLAQKGWQQETSPKAGKKTQPVVIANGADKITIGHSNFSTNSTNKETFVAMLEAYQKMHNDKPPQISTTNQQDVATWAEAYQQVYNKQMPADVITVASTTARTASDPATPAEKHATPGSHP